MAPTRCQIAVSLRDDAHVAQGLAEPIALHLLRGCIPGFGEEPLFLEKRRITERTTTIEVVVDERPVRAGIDPYNKLIDRDSEDNVRMVSERARPS